MPVVRKRPLKVGLLLPIAGEWMAGKTARWTDMAAMAKHAEDIGFDSVWVSDHLFYRFGEPGEPTRATWECWSLLSALSAITLRVEIGTFVVCTAFRNPALLAKAADAVDDISGGRLILGVGAGYHEPEFSAFGYPFDHRVGRFEEAIAIIHALLREGKTDFQGKYHQARECEIVPRLSLRNGPPILMGPRSNAPRMLALMARYADCWGVFNVNAIEAYLPMREAVDAACLKIGRDPTTLGRTICVSIDVPGLETAIDNQSWVRRFRMSFTGRGVPVSGSAGAVLEHLRSLAKVGVQHVVAWLDPLSLEGIDKFGQMLVALDQG